MCASLAEVLGFSSFQKAKYGTKTLFSGADINNELKMLLWCWALVWCYLWQNVAFLLSSCQMIVIYWQISVCRPKWMVLEVACNMRFGKWVSLNPGVVLLLSDSYRHCKTFLKLPCFCHKSVRLFSTLRGSNDLEWNAGEIAELKTLKALFSSLGGGFLSCVCLSCLLNPDLKLLLRASSLDCISIVMCSCLKDLLERSKIQWGMTLCPASLSFS